MNELSKNGYLAFGARAVMNKIVCPVSGNTTGSRISRMINKLKKNKYYSAYYSGLLKNKNEKNKLKKLSSIKCS